MSQLSYCNVIFFQNAVIFLVETECGDYMYADHFTNNI